MTDRTGDALFVTMAPMNTVHTGCPSLAISCITTILLAAVLLTGCAGPGHVYCSTCDVAFDACLVEDDYEACRLMRRYCHGWCTGATSCDEGCDGASWGCEASPLLRSTCVRTIDACRAYCDSESEALDFDSPPVDAPPAEPSADETAPGTG